MIAAIAGHIERDVRIACASLRARHDMGRWFHAVTNRQLAIAAWLC
jgi:hypothetical protein